MVWFAYVESFEKWVAKDAATLKKRGRYERESAESDRSEISID
jgi:hypothetical protein